METSDWIALGSAVTATAALIYTRTQARAAKKANTTAEEANVIARDANRVSLEASETAKQALDLARTQFDAEQQARHEADGPTFQIESAVKEYSGEWFANIRVQQVGGTALKIANVTVSGADVRGIQRGRYGDDWVEQPVEWKIPAPGTALELYVELEHEHLDPVNMRIGLECRATDGRTWNRELTAQPVAPPPQSRDGRRGRI
ncbi:hypothetical protein [Streptomyces sp. NBC_00454]|uniref:hypothetical protein n=1 Tax=Streptomyces sp. NBC_00454 TaxID=2975747 RepID=UPI0032530B09